QRETAAPLARPLPLYREPVLPPHPREGPPPPNPPPSPSEAQEEFAASPALPAPAAPTKPPATPPVAIVVPAGLGNPGVWKPPPPGSTLEERVRRLENALAALQESQQREPPRAEQVSSHQTRHLIEAGQRLLPLAVDALQGTVAPADVVKLKPPPQRQPWLFFDIYTEVRAIVRMYVDPRYRLTWTARLAPIAF